MNAVVAEGGSGNGQVAELVAPDSSQTHVNASNNLAYALQPTMYPVKQVSPPILLFITSVSFFVCFSSVNESHIFEFVAWEICSVHAQ